MKISKEQWIESEHHHEAMIRMTASESAKKEFRRKPYEIKRGGASEQANTK